MTRPAGPLIIHRVDKSALRRAIVTLLEAELAQQTEAAEASRREATDVDSRAEGKFDMRGQSAAYLAEGQARLAGEIAASIAAFEALPLRSFGPGEAIAIGALATLDAPGKRAVYFLGPAHGGLDVEIKATTVTVITAASSLGRSLLGRRAGDSIVLAGRNSAGVHRVASVE